MMEQKVITMKNFALAKYCLLAIYTIAFSFFISCSDEPIENHPASVAPSLSPSGNQDVKLATIDLGNSNLIGLYEQSSGNILVRFTKNQQDAESMDGEFNRIEKLLDTLIRQNRSVYEIYNALAPVSDASAIAALKAASIRQQKLEHKAYLVENYYPTASLANSRRAPNGKAAVSNGWTQVLSGYFIRGYYTGTVYGSYGVYQGGIYWERSSVFPPWFTWGTFQSDYGKTYTAVFICDPFAQFWFDLPPYTYVSWINYDAYGYTVQPCP